MMKPLCVLHDTKMIMFVLPVSNTLLKNSSIIYLKPYLESNFQCASRWQYQYGNVEDELYTVQHFDPKIDYGQVHVRNKFFIMRQVKRGDVHGQAHSHGKSRVIPQDTCAWAFTLHVSCMQLPDSP